MKINFLHIILFILLGVIGGCWLFDHIHITKGSKTWQDSAVSNHKLYMACRQAKVFDSVEIILFHDTVWVHPKPVANVTPDPVSAKFCDSTFAGTYKYTRGILTGKIDYRIHAKDCSSEVMFDKIELPVEHKSSIIDTCIAKPPIIIDIRRSRLGLWCGLGINNIKQFPALSLGGFWFFRDKGFIAPGFMYDAIANKSYGIINIGINLLK